MVLKLLSVFFGALPVRIQNRLFQVLQKSLRSHAGKRYIAERDGVLSGVFEGMRLPSDISAQNYTFAHMAGVYEPHVQNIIRDHIGEAKRFIDVGCASGFFSVGVPYAFQIPAVGYDLDQVQVDYANQLAKRNDVTDISIHKLATFDTDYNKELQDGDFVLVDIEGGEVDFINMITPALSSKITWLFEVHHTKDRDVKAMGNALIKTLSQTHDYKIFKEEFVLNFEDASALKSIHRNDYVFLTNNFRTTHLDWILFTPKS